MKAAAPAGLLLLLAFAVPLALAGWLLRGRLLPAWTGAPARLAEIVIALSGLVLAAELLGSVGALSPAPLVLACVALGAGSWVWARRPRSARPAQSPAAPPAGLAAIGLGAFAVGVAVASWAVYTRAAFQKGMLEFDTLWYHMPFAARFAEEGSLVHIHYVGDASPSYLPATAELFHAAGILALGNDLLSPALNLAWLGVAFLAAWCIGRPAGVGPATLAASALVIAGANFAETQAGSAKNDIVGLALLLAAVALIVNGREERPALGIAGMAAGLAIGTRLNALAPVLALSIAVLALNPRRREVVGIWGLGLLVTGSFWYLRNLASTGNPLPWFGLELGPLTLHSVPPPFDCGNTTLADYAGRLGAARHDIVPQLSDALGPAWPLLVAIAAAGIVAGLVQRGSRLTLVLALVAARHDDRIHGHARGRRWA